MFAQKCNTKYDDINMELALYLDESTLVKYPNDEYMQDKDTVINSTGTGTLGRVGIYRRTDNRREMPVVPDSHVTVIRANNEISAEYIYHFLKAYQQELEKLGEGSTNQKELKPLTLKNLIVALPPYAEQERIGNRIIQYKSHSSKSSEEHLSDYDSSLRNIFTKAMKIKQSDLNGRKNIKIKPSKLCILCTQVHNMRWL